MRVDFTRIFNHKRIAILAVIFIVIEAVPAIITHPNPIIFVKVVLWIFGAVFVWLNKNWAAIYLACLASAYFIVDIILPIPQLITALRSLPPQLTIQNKYIPHFIILSMTIEVVFLSCFIYYGIRIFQKKLKAT
jgi:hypothetical protein